MFVRTGSLLLLVLATSACGGSSDDPKFPTEHPRIYLSPNRDRLEAALAANTAPARRFKEMVDAWIDGRDIWGFMTWHAAMLGQLTGDAKYCKKAVETVEAQVKAAEADIDAGMQPDVAGDSYLGVGELIGDVALVYDWCNGDLSSSQKTRWIEYANQAVWNVWHPKEAKWGSKTFDWSGWSVDNPSNNYYYSFLRATMLLGLATKGENPQADDWIAKFHDEKIEGQLVPMFDADLVGGASREGTGYGVAMHRLFELYDIWKDTTGETIATKTTHTRASMVAFMHQIVPTLDKVAPTGDHSRDSTAAFFDYHRNYLLELTRAFPTESIAQKAKGLLAASSVTEMSSQFMFAYDFINDDPKLEAKPLDGLNTAYHASGIGQVYARSGWDKSASWVNLTAGPYTESHAHQDQGALMFYKGAWLAYDANIQSHSGLSQKTTSHSLVRIDKGGMPIEQVGSTTSTLMALHQDSKFVYASADLTPAYKNNASIQKVHREMVFVLPDVVIVYDRVQSGTGTSQVWQLQTPTQPAINGATATVTNSGHTLTVTKILGGTLTAFDMKDSDINGGFRLDESMAAGDNRYLHVLSADGAATSATANGANGVTVMLANGQSVTATFNQDSVGGMLTIGGSNVPLAAGVDKLDE